MKGNFPSFGNYKMFLLSRRLLHTKKLIWFTSLEFLQGYRLRFFDFAERKIGVWTMKKDIEPNILELTTRPQSLDDLNFMILSKGFKHGSAKVVL